MKRVLYAFVIGNIMYIMLCTIPDISHAVNLTSKYQANPGLEHWIAIKNILKYLIRTKDIFLVYGGGNLKFEGYTDSNFMLDVDNRKLNSGHVFIHNGGIVSWQSGKYNTVADSTTKAKYISTSEAIKEVVWIKKFVSELGVVPSIIGPVPFYCDNIGQLLRPRKPSPIKNLNTLSSTSI